MYYYVQRVKKVVITKFDIRQTENNNEIWMCDLLNNVLLFDVKCYMPKL